MRTELKLVAWEITKSCNLSCAHCRAGEVGFFPGELSTEECFRLIDEILKVGRPILILTGGEPLLRRDFFQIAGYAANHGLRVVIGTNGTVIAEETAQRLAEIPISRIGVSLDFPFPKSQDKFRGKEGAFQEATQGIANARRAGLEVQINSTVTKLNLAYLDELLELALKIGAVAFHPFILVPTGRGRELKAIELSPEEQEQILSWFYDKQVELKEKMFLKPTCAPYYFRVIQQKGKFAEAKPVGAFNPKSSLTRGCLAGVGFCFISHRGRVQGCGYLDVEVGNVREESLSRIWNSSSLFQELRELSKLKGKCGGCEYKKLCGGCRARAYEITGDYLGPEPYCIYEPDIS